MAASRRTRLLAVLLLVTVAGAGLFAWRVFVPRARVFIGTSFGSAVDSAITLPPTAPIRVLLSLPHKLGRAGFVSLELHALDGGDRVLQVIPVRVASDRDEVVFAMPHVAQLVGPTRGRFRIVFTRDSESLGAGEFRVTAG